MTEMSPRLDLLIFNHEQPNLLANVFPRAVGLDSTVFF